MLPVDGLVRSVAASLYGIDTAWPPLTAVMAVLSELANAVWVLYAYADDTQMQHSDIRNVAHRVLVMNINMIKKENVLRVP